MLRPPSLPHLSLTLTAPALLPPPPSTLTCSMDVSFHLFRFVVSGRGLTRPAHWYYICTRQRWSVPRHTQIWAAVSPSGVRLGAPLVAPTTIPCLHRLMARAFEGVNYRFVGRLGSLCLLEQRIRIMIFHDDDFVVDSIVFFSPLFPTGTQDLAFVVGGDDGFSCSSCCWFLRRRLTASKASSTTFAPFENAPNSRIERSVRRDPDRNRLGTLRPKWS